MSAPVVMSIEQVPSEGYVQQMMYPQMMPCCFVAVPEFCEGMQIHPSAGWQPMWPQGPYRGQPDSWQGSKRRSHQQPGFFAAPMWPQQSTGNQEPVQIELSNLPEMLCNRNCLEASIEQAGLESQVQGLEIGSGGNGTAKVTLASQAAAEKCIQHFNGLRWAKSSEPVSARYLQQTRVEEEPVLPQQPVTEEAKAKKASEVAKGLEAAGLLCRTPKRTPPSSPFSTCSTTAPMSPPSMKPRWADIDEDSDEDEDNWSKSTHADEEAQATSDSASNSEC